ncbi:MAG: hypothetical protein FJW35_15705 [Acidobacteria bacterium]|nr:hypothetical protein [Acidobacteriota bacterium]
MVTLKIKIESHRKDCVGLRQGDEPNGQLVEYVREFRPYEWTGTPAPEVYDGFGTLRVGPYLVLVDVCSAEWQIGRYRSGLHGVDPVDDAEAVDLIPTVVSNLIGRICAGDPKE